MEPYKIVFVDDEAEILDLYKTIVSDMPYEAVFMTNPIKMQEYLIENQKSVLLCVSDYSMPKCTGYQLQTNLLKEGVQLPFVIVSAHLTKEMALKGMEIKISYILNKPIDATEFLRIVDSLINERIEVLNEEREMVVDFLDEAKSMVEEVEDIILAIEEDPHDHESVNKYFRILHTIKGTAACMGFSKVSEFAHKYEDFVSLIKKGELYPNKAVVDVLLNGYDRLKLCMSTVEQNYSDDVLEIKDLLLALNFDREKYVQIQEQMTLGEGVEAKGPVGVIKELKETKDEKMSVSLSILDQFMELSGEVTVLRNALRKSFLNLEAKIGTSDEDLEKMGSNLEEMHKITSLLQFQVSEMRKVPLKSVFRPFSRVVRDVSKANNKTVNFIIEGDHLRVDTVIAKLLSATLIHMIRNGVDHGLEGTEDRVKAKKRESGLLKLSAFDKGESLLVTLEDDGRGLNREVIKQKAIEKGLYSQSELDAFPDGRILNIIYEPGFSTSAVITDISGRGVGMDMVASAIRDFGGRISIESEVGKGTIFNLDIPYPKSILIINALMVAIEKCQYAMSTEDVIEVIRVSERVKKNFKQVKDNFFYDYQDSLIPVLDLKNVLNSSRETNVEGANNLVIVRASNKFLGLIVDEVIDLEEVVKRDLPTQTADEEMFYSGVSISGDGQLALILDIEDIAKKLVHTKSSEEEIEVEDEEQENEVENSLYEEEYLTVELECSGRFAIPLTNVGRLERLKCQKIEYCGSFPIYRYNNAVMPLILTDQILGLCEADINDFCESNSEIDVVVLNSNGQQYGMIVKRISDIFKTKESINEVVTDRRGILGTLSHANKYVNILNVLELIDESKVKKVKVEINRDQLSA